MTTRSLARQPFRLAAATLALAVAGGFAVSADAQPRHGDHAMSGGMGMPMMGSPAHVDRMLDAVNASAEQKSQVKAIVDAAFADLKAQRDSGRALMDQQMQLFAQPSVDARTAEALRQQMLARHDTASKRMLQAMLDVSRVLTPEQRKQLADKMAERRSMMERHQRDGRGSGRPQS